MIRYDDLNKFKKYNEKLITLIHEYNNKKLSYNKIQNYLRFNELPKIDILPNDSIDNKYPFYNLGKFTKEVVKINIEDITGYNTEDNNSYTKVHMYSSAIKVMKAIEYIEGPEKEKYKPITIHNINEDYFIESGKNRCYAHILLGKKEISCELKKYDYNEFIKNSHVYCTNYDNLKSSEFILITEEGKEVKLNKDDVIELHKQNIHFTR